MALGPTPEPPPPILAWRRRSLRRPTGSRAVWSLSVGDDRESSLYQFSLWRSCALLGFIRLYSALSTPGPPPTRCAVHRGMERGNTSRGRMDRSRLRGGVCRCLPGILLLVLAGYAVASTATFISDGALGSEISGAAARSLLQAKKGCPVDFEFMNYTIITSQCKGPQYSAKLCCKAFKDFACPYAEKLNDLTSDCASTMFSYINLYGKYPPGLFSSECKDSYRGLECPAKAEFDSTDANAATVALVIPTLGAVLTLFMLHFHLF